MSCIKCCKTDVFQNNKCKKCYNICSNIDCKKKVFHDEFCSFHFNNSNIVLNEGKDKNKIKKQKKKLNEEIINQIVQSKIKLYQNKRKKLIDDFLKAEFNNDDLYEKYDIDYSSYYMSLLEEDCDNRVFDISKNFTIRNLNQLYKDKISLISDDDHIRNYKITKYNEVYNSQYSRIFNLKRIKIKEMIDNILSSEEKIQEVCKRSYYHVNNFYKIVLHIDDQKIYRLHYWKKVEFEQNPHSHGWNFESIIISGKFRNTTFEETNEDEDQDKKSKKMIKNKIILNKNTSSTKTEEIENVNLRIQSDIYFQNRDVYEMDSKQIHTFTPIDDNSITFIEQDKKHDDYAFIYSSNELEKNQKIPNITREELINLLNDVKSYHFFSN